MGYKFLNLKNTVELVIKLLVTKRYTPNELSKKTSNDEVMLLFKASNI
jgi:hypothetical protein